MTIKWEPRDLWIGLFWDQRQDGKHFYVCLVPTVVIHWVYREHETSVAEQVRSRLRDRVFVAVMLGVYRGIVAVHRKLSAP